MMTAEYEMIASTEKWPGEANMIAWGYKELSLAPINPWAVVAELDAVGSPWRMIGAESFDVIIYTSEGDTVAEFIMEDSGLFRPFSCFEGSAA